ncbi:hypothetical protein B4U80_03063 [Leptotrombidium deliense]|uniref:Ig-like domain-containing protein n=1 Tax=Leptotrombidium deliense TaxID=299467 RepID=A0A443SLU2_9ACAR|nr:hypothetical protein B4U80_03063 [Leptotrombidium deliense]
MNLLKTVRLRKEGKAQKDVQVSKSLDTYSLLDHFVHVSLVTEPPVIITSPDHQKPIEVFEGRQLSLKCQCDGNPHPTVKWYTKLSHIPMPGEEYQLHVVSRGDAGEYTCVADNKIGPPVTAKFIVNVLFRPICKTDSSILNVKKGKDCVLICNVEADPKPNIWWFKDHTQGTLDSNVTHKGGNMYQSMMSFPIKNEDDYGAFRCMANNTAGTATQMFLVSGAVPHIKISLKRDEYSSDHKKFKIDIHIDSDAECDKCELQCAPVNGHPFMETVKLQPRENHNSSKFTETIDSDKFNANLMPNTDYLLRMRCLNKNGWSEWSNTERIVLYYTCGEDFSVNDEWKYLISHADYGKSPYKTTYACSSFIKTTNCAKILVKVIEVDQTLRQRCTSARTSFSSIQIKEKNSERNNAFHYICSESKTGIVSQNDQLTLSVNPMTQRQPVTSMYGFKIGLKCDNDQIATS